MVDVMAHVKLDQVSKSFKGHTALHDLSIEIAGPPVRLYSNFIRGIRSLPVRIQAG